MARPVVNDSVAPDREPWKENVGWGCWNVLRNAIVGCDVSLRCHDPIYLVSSEQSKPLTPCFDLIDGI